MNNKIFGKLAFGAIVSAIVIGTLDQFSPKLAWIYIFIVFLIVSIALRDQLFTGINESIGVIKSK